MTTLICSGALFSGWHDILEKYVPADSSGHAAYTEISALASEICQQQFPEPDELNWTPFTPESKYKKSMGQLLSNIENEQQFIWDDSNSCLYLDFWKKLAENARFLLFYSSPEFELGNFISKQPFDAAQVERVISAWSVRTQAMLTFFMNNRDRCLLIDVQSTGFENGSFTEAINKEFDLGLEHGTLITSPQNENPVLIEYLATTLLLNKHPVSELYDEVRSAATVIGDQDKSISGIENRSKSLINDFLAEVASYKKLSITRPKLEDELSLSQLQINQMAEELEFYFQKSTEQEEITTTMADYLSDDPLLKIARRARQMQ